MKASTVEKCWDLLKRIPLDYGCIIFYRDSNIIDSLPNLLVVDHYKNKRAGIYEGEISHTLDIVDRCTRDPYGKVYIEEVFKDKIITRVQITKDNIDQIILDTLNDLLVRYTTCIL